MSNQDKPLLSVVDVGVTYLEARSIFNRRTFDALKSVSFDINSGDSIGVLGRNGAGKSTLLRLLAGIIDPDRGVLKGDNVTTALLSLQVGFNGDADGRSNILLSGMLLGFSKLEVLEHMDAIIEFTELGVAIDKPVRAYSTGMKTRLGFSIAFLLQPDILLIDEVLGVGDAHFREKSTAAMRARILSSQTVVLVSHQAQTIKNLCNRAVWIEEGRVKMDGVASEVVDCYENYIV